MARAIRAGRMVAPSWVADTPLGAIALTDTPRSRFVNAGVNCER